MSTMDALTTVIVGVALEYPRRRNTLVAKVTPVGIAAALTIRSDGMPNADMDAMTVYAPSAASAP